MPDERRKSVRIKKVISVRYTEDGKKWDITSIKDISEKGMCFTTHEEFVPNDVITFLIKIPSMPLEWIELTGRVVKRQSHITRVEFVNLQDNHKELIRQHIKWFLSKHGGWQK
ncbi:MAG: PilZ domain-containing protein [Candidatus Omnitrophota bacterium]